MLVRKRSSYQRNCTFANENEKIADEERQRKKSINADTFSTVLTERLPRRTLVIARGECRGHGGQKTVFVDSLTAHKVSTDPHQDAGDVEGERGGEGGGPGWTGDVSDAVPVAEWTCQTLLTTETPSAPLQELHGGQLQQSPAQRVGRTLGRDAPARGRS